MNESNHHLRHTLTLAHQNTHLNCIEIRKFVHLISMQIRFVSRILCCCWALFFYAIRLFFSTQTFRSVSFFSSLLLSLSVIISLPLNKGFLVEYFLGHAHIF